MNNTTYQIGSVGETGLLGYGVTFRIGRIRVQISVGVWLNFVWTGLVPVTVGSSKYEININKTTAVVVDTATGNTERIRLTEVVTEASIFGPTM